VRASEAHVVQALDGERQSTTDYTDKHSKKDEADHRPSSPGVHPDHGDSSADKEAEDEKQHGVAEEWQGCEATIKAKQDLSESHCNLTRVRHPSRSGFPYTCWREDNLTHQRTFPLLWGGRHDACEMLEGRVRHHGFLEGCPSSSPAKDGSGFAQMCKHLVRCHSRKVHEVHVFIKGVGYPQT
jgi:hypothetical protein